MNPKYDNIMTFSQLLRDIFESSRERIKTPITGAFITAFILYNWRPILQLIFSKMAMEDRITIVDVEYSSPYAIIVPILIAVFYVTGLPLIVNWLDGLMNPIKQSRVKKIYGNKDFELIEKIKIASKELKLKNVESDNKEIEDFTLKIDQMVLEKNQMQKEHNLKISEYTKRFADITATMENMTANENIRLQEVSHLKEEVAKNAKNFQDIIYVLLHINSEDVMILNTFNHNKNFVRDLSDKHASLFRELKLIEVTNLGEVILTSLGKSVQQTLTNNSFKFKN